MSTGFGRSQPKRQSKKTATKKSRRSSNSPPAPQAEVQSDTAIQSEVEAFFAQYQQENPEEMALAWEIGVYNPLAQVDLLAVGARSLQPAETDWLYMAKIVGWLQLEEDENELNTVYFTAPPPAFALEQADWYVRPDLTTFLEEPQRLSEVVERYPIPLKGVLDAIAYQVDGMGWSIEQVEVLMQELFGQGNPELTRDDWQSLLSELRSKARNQD